VPPVTWSRFEPPVVEASPPGDGAPEGGVEASLGGDGVPEDGGGVPEDGGEVPPGTGTKDKVPPVAWSRLGSVEVVVEPVSLDAGAKDDVPPVAWSRLAVAGLVDVGAEPVTVEVPATSTEGGLRDCVPPVAGSGLTGGGVPWAEVIEVDPAAVEVPVAVPTTLEDVVEPAAMEGPETAARAGTKDNCPPLT